MDQVLYKLNGQVIKYPDLVAKVQKQISKDHVEELANYLKTTNGQQYAKKLIHDFIMKNHIQSNTSETISDLVERIYQDMAGESFINKYRTTPGFQELNINAWNEIYVNINDKYFKIPETFLSPQHGKDVIRRLLASSNHIIDDSKPVAVGSLSDDTRIEVEISPIVPAQCGLAGSIRRVNLESALKSDSVLDIATPEIMEFLKCCAEYGTSICVSGRTGTGKSTFEGWLLSNMKGRIITIEDDSRQLSSSSIKRYDKDGNALNEVINLYTRKIDEHGHGINIDTIYLLDVVLKQHPDYICVDEMVSGEAFTAQEAARTGHMVLSSIHSTSAEKSYGRMVTLAQRVSQFDYASLMQLMVEAFPLVVYLQQSKIDGKRRITKVLEGEDYNVTTGLESRILYQFETTDNANGKVVGKFRKVNGISERLEQILIDNGAPKAMVEKYTSKEW